MNSKIKILVVDDNQAFAKIFIKILLSSFEDRIELIETAENGLECIKKVQNKNYDVVFMDIEMPELDGVEATKYICNNFRNTKVIAVSVHSELDDFQKMLEAGAKNYIIKDKISKEYLESLFAKL